MGVENECQVEYVKTSGFGFGFGEKKCLNIVLTLIFFSYFGH